LDKLLSAISKSYKTNDTESIIDKRIELEDKYDETEITSEQKQCIKGTLMFYTKINVTIK
jgi:hypothetical protein